ncbi:MAG TPA: hypothetical protein VHY35_17850 [Stellaceae bacterium]|jgi:hypothetical protein|nr:hypothetical protein [Stellaceae bacterium]
MTAIPTNTRLDELHRQLDGMDIDIQHDERALADKRQERAVIAARIEEHEIIAAGQGDGADRSPEPQPQPPVAERRPVQREVMALLEPTDDDADEAMCEVDIVAQTGLPKASVHVFLLNAVRSGKLVREGDFYSLPKSAAAGPAELQDAAE